MLEATYAMERGVLPFIGFAHSDVPGLGSRARKACEKAAYFCCSGGGGQSCQGSCRSSDFGKLASPVLLCKRIQKRKKIVMLWKHLKSDLFYISSSHQFSLGGEKRILIFYYWFLTKSVMIDMVVVQTHEICQCRNWFADKLVIVTIIDYFVPKK